MGVIVVFQSFKVFAGFFTVELVETIDFLLFLLGWSGRPGYSLTDKA
jgi:hypothetical protein